MPAILIKDIDAIASTFAAILAESWRVKEPYVQRERVQLYVEVRSDADGAVTELEHLRPAALALAKWLDEAGARRLEPMELPGGDNCESVNATAGHVVVRCVRMLQLFPDPVYLLDDNDEIVLDADGEALWDDEAMSRQVVPFWRVRFDILGD